MEFWRGYCPTHVMIQSSAIDLIKKGHPSAEFIMHPECGCLTKSMHLADQILSTEGMVRYVRGSKSKEFIVATETGILHRMRQDNPDKVFIPAESGAVCSYMKMNTMEKILKSLEDLEPEVRVPEPIANRARLAIQRMLDIS